jgi:hypothetical protein
MMWCMRCCWHSGFLRAKMLIPSNKQECLQDEDFLSKIKHNISLRNCELLSEFFGRKVKDKKKIITFSSNCLPCWSYNIQEESSLHFAKTIEILPTVSSLSSKRIETCQLPVALFLQLIYWPSPSWLLSSDLGFLYPSLLKWAFQIWSNPLDMAMQYEEHVTLVPITTIISTDIIEDLKTFITLSIATTSNFLHINYW